MRFKKPMKFVS